MSPAKKPTKPIFNRIRLLRTERNLSRAQLADAIGVNVQTIGALERSDHYPSLDLALNLSETFGLPIEAIFSRTEFTPLSTQIYAGDQ
ncbi:helix-turn-helix transcriptional regulator [Corynebacterium sp. H128]|uniref:helix-turn-helix transcriptional regulator n=1 Tax=unclassified Corynebacterium TaxID=2624378 RepID=UPI0030A1D5E2